MMKYIYAIIDLDTNDIYIGSTYDIDRRMSGHKSIYNKCSSKNIIINNNYKVKILCSSDKWNKLTTKIMEQKYINKYKSNAKYNVVNVNSVINIPHPPPTKEQIESNKKTINAYQEFCIFKSWVLTWNEEWIGLHNWDETPLNDDNMLFIDYNIFE